MTFGRIAVVSLLGLALVGCGGSGSRGSAGGSGGASGGSGGHAGAATGVVNQTITPTLKLSVPSNVRAGTYHTTITLTLSSGP